MGKTPNINQKAAAAKAVLTGGDPAQLAIELGVSVGELKSWASAFDSGGRERLRLSFPTASRKAKAAPPSPEIKTVAEAVEYALSWKGKRTYGQYLSNALAVVLANGLRGLGFAGVLPDERGGFESPARSARGVKKLDVNFSTPEMGLGLGLSVKTISTPDPQTKRFTKNYSRNDNELRAEAVDYHRRQPYAVLGGFLLLPIQCCDDAGAGRGEEAGVSSFGAAVRYFRWRTPRPEPEDDADRFEAFFVGVYDEEGQAGFWPVHDVRSRPPRKGRPEPSLLMTLDEALADCARLYDERNNPLFTFAAD